MFAASSTSTSQQNLQLLNHLFGKPVRLTLWLSQRIIFVDNDLALKRALTKTSPHHVALPIILPRRLPQRFTPNKPLNGPEGLPLLQHERIVDRRHIRKVPDVQRAAVERQKVLARAQLGHALVLAVASGEVQRRVSLTVSVGLPVDAAAQVEEVGERPPGVLQDGVHDGGGELDPVCAVFVGPGGGEGVDEGGEEVMVPVVVGEEVVSGFVEPDEDI